jgi:hypothetical protein
MKSLLIQTGTMFFLLVPLSARAQTFPPIQPGATSYVITPEEATGLVINTLYLPKGFTLKVDARVKSIEWNVDKIKIEEGATIDLSAPLAKPSKAADGGPPPGQAGYCTAGVGGAAGGNGTSGTPGLSLTIHNVSSIDNQGSLWIRTDGGPGGNGGNGGTGQQGGGHRSTVGGGGPFFHGGGCNAAGGGAGGRAGAAGAGGMPGKVIITFKETGTTPITNGGIAPDCGPSQRPASVQGATGVIVIWGASGCPGSPGVVGKNGIGG